MSDTPTEEEALWKSIKHYSMDELAQEIGRLCMYWSELEMAISLLLSDLLRIEEAVPKNLILGALDFRSKLHMLLPLGFHRKPSDQWYADLNEHVNHIDNVLRPERNRIIHDYWIEMPGMDEPHRMQFTGRVVNEQSRTKKLELATYKPFTEKDVGLLYVKIIAARTRTFALRGHVAPPNTLLSLAGLPRRTPDQKPSTDRAQPEPPPEGAE